MGGGREKQKPHLLVESSCGIRQEPTLSDVPGAWMKITQWKCISWADFVHHLPEKPFSPIQEAIKETNFSWNQGGGVLLYWALWSRKPGKILSCSLSWELLKQTVREWLRNTISYEKGKVCSQKQPGCWITCLLDIPSGPKIPDPEITGPCSFRGLNL